MTLSTIQATRDIADLWLGIAKTVELDAKSLHELIDRCVKYMKTDETSFSNTSQTELKQAISATSQISSQLREQLDAINSIEHFQSVLS